MCKFPFYSYCIAVKWEKMHFISKGEDLKDHKRRGAKKNGGGSTKGSRRKRKGRLIEDVLIGKQTLSCPAPKQIH